MPAPRTALLRLLLHAYPDRVAQRRAPGSPRALMVGGRGIELEPASVVRDAALFLALDPREVPGGGESRVRLASALREDWLAEVHPHLVTERLEHRFDPERDRVVTARVRRFADLVLAERIVGAREDPEGASRALLEHLAPRLGEMLEKDERAGRLAARWRFLAAAMPDAGLPPLDDATLREALGAACSGRTSPSEIADGALADALHAVLPWPARRALDEHAPETLEVASGSRIRLEYRGADAPPILAVRLQEMFGTAETPRLAGGRVPVVVHLLGPNYRPVQVTSDLASFWRTTYAEVRRELRARYPKHPWPENPLEAPAVAVGRRRRPQ